MTPKVKIKVPRFRITLYSIFAAFSLLFVFVERGIYGTLFHENTFDFKELLAPYIGMVIGAFIIAQISSYLIEKQRYKLFAVIAGIIIAALLIIYVPFIREFLLWLFGFVSGSSYQNPFLGFVQGIMVGAVIGFILYALLYFFKSPLPLLLFYIVNLYDTMAGRESKESLYYGILIFILFFLLAVFFFTQHRVSLKKTATSSLLILATLILVGLGTSYAVSSAINQEQIRKLELIQQIREKQRAEEQTKQPEQVSIPIDQPVGGATVDIVGLYQAPSPVYLKFELFSITQMSDKLQILPIKTDHMVSAYQLSRSEREKEAKVVFAHFSGQNLLTAERTTSFDATTYRLIDGILAKRLVSAAVEQVSTYEFTYTTYRAGDIQYPDQYAQTDYTSVSVLSEQYDEIAALTREITKGLHTDFEKARAIQQYFHNNFTYTLNPHFNDKVNPIDDFLFETKKGYCVQYAVATSIMLDIIDVQSRMVGGYFSAEYVPELDSYVIVSKQAHVWNEVFIAEYGWVTIDSTPFAPAAGTEVTGGVPLTEEEKQQVKAQLKAVAPNISFDDIYDSSGEAMPPIEPGKVLQETEQEIREREANERKELAKKLEEEKKAAEEAKKKQEEQSKKTRAVVIAVAVIVGGGGSIVYFVYRRIKYQKQLELQAFISKMTNMDNKIRRQIIKKYSLDNSFMSESSKRFLKQLPSQIGELPDLVEFYAVWNKVRFANSHTDAELKLLTQLSQKLQAIR